MRWCLPCHCRTAGCGTAASLRFTISVAMPVSFTTSTVSYYSATLRMLVTGSDDPPWRVISSIASWEPKATPVTGTRLVLVHFALVGVIASQFTLCHSRDSSRQYSFPSRPRQCAGLRSFTQFTVLTSHFVEPSLRLPVAIVCCPISVPTVY